LSSTMWKSLPRIDGVDSRASACEVLFTESGPLARKSQLAVMPFTRTWPSTPLRVTFHWVPDRNEHHRGQNPHRPGRRCDIYWPPCGYRLGMGSLGKKETAFYSALDSVSNRFRTSLPLCPARGFVDGLRTIRSWFRVLRSIAAPDFSLGRPAITFRIGVCHLRHLAAKSAALVRAWLCPWNAPLLVCDGGR